MDFFWLFDDDGDDEGGEGDDHDDEALTELGESLDHGRLVLADRLHRGHVVRREVEAVTLTWTKKHYHLEVLLE